MTLPIYPRTFAVGAVVDGWNIGGRLPIAPGAITLAIEGVSRRVAHLGVDQVVHRDKRVTMYESRLIPPWFNTHVVLHGDGRSALAAVPMWKRRSLIGALRVAGFAVTERRT